METTLTFLELMPLGQSVFDQGSRTIMNKNKGIVIRNMQGRTEELEVWKEQIKVTNQVS